MDSGNTGIDPHDLSTLNGKKIAVNEGSYQKLLLVNWAEANDLDIEIVGLHIGNSEAWQLVLDGTYDGYVTIGVYAGNGDAVCKIGHSEFYFVTNNDSEALMRELNAALDAIQSENRYYNQQLWDKYLGNQGASRFLSLQEAEWLKEHGTIRVGYRDDYLPFCGTDPETGEAAGMLKDYLEEAATLFENADISFQLIAYPSTQAAKEALMCGQIDCVFPVNMTLSEAEQEDLLISDPVVESRMDLIVSDANYANMDPTGNIRLAINEGNTGYDRILHENFPNCEIVPFATTGECLKGIARGEADGIVVNPYLVANVSKYLNELKLTAITTSAMSEQDFAIHTGDTELYAILNRIRHLIPDSSVQSMVLSNTEIDNTVTFYDFVRAYFLQMLTGAALLVAVLVFFLLRSRKAEKAARLAKERTASANAEIQEVNSRLEALTAGQKAQIEEISALNAALERAKAEAEAASSAKTSFLFSMSHDIRTPMNAIMGFRDLLEKHQEEPEKRADYLKKIEESSSVLLSIINNVLEMARIEKATIDIEETAWSAEQFNDTLYSIFQEMMAQKGITFTRQIKVQHPFVYCDSIKLREVFINILSNAWKYTNAGGSVSMLLEEIPSDREGYAIYRTSISDTGIGMREEFLPHLFEEFSRENTTTESRIEGTGLGMPIVKRLVDLMGGTVEVRSKKGVGSTFVVTLPHRIAERSSLVEHAGVEIDPKLFAGKRILLAEDNDLNAEIAAEILGEAGFLVDRAEDGVICCDKLLHAEADHYDLILMDIQMPNRNGYEATRVIRRMSDPEKANIPILAMTANAFEEDKREAFRAGMNAHLAKPINVAELMKALAGVLG